MQDSRQRFGERVIAFNASLALDAKLPQGISVMNPFCENACATPASTDFYKKYYADNRIRGIILGINPGRFGAGITGVPFTDPKRLASECGIILPQCPPAHEPSSEFVYAVVNAMGGPKKFYGKWYINSICPLGFTKRTASGRQVNYNYYDDAALEAAVLPFILRTLKEQIAFGVNTAACICLGTGKNAAFMKKLNSTHNFFDEVVPLEHPRYVMQYKYANRAEYVAKYASVLASIMP